jgi:hypothetical protein
VSKLVNQWLDLFRAGDYSAKGKGTFTEKDLQQIVDNYDPDYHEAPAVIGHPKTDGPAYGWFSKLRVVGDKLQGMMRQADPAFEEAVQKGRFKKRSVSLYNDAKGWSLRHVGFLGAQPPEIKGLADIKFEQADQEAIEIEFSEESDMADNNDAAVEGAIARFFAKFTSKQEPANKTFTEEEVSRIAKDAADAAVKAAVDPLKIQFTERNTALATAETKQRATEAIAKVKAAGAWVPAFGKMGLEAVFADLAENTTATIEFGEGDAKVKKTPLEALTSFMEGLKQIVPNAAIYTGQSASGAGAHGKTTSYNETPQTPVDQNSVRFHEEIEKYVESHKVDYRAAMRAVAKKNPELTVPGGATAGAV